MKTIKKLRNNTASLNIETEVWKIALLSRRIQ